MTHSSAGRRLRVQDVTVRWLEAGAGVPTVLLHGIPTSPALWRRVIPLLEGTRTLAWELVGYGASIQEGAGRDISLDRQADYLLGWMDALGIERAVYAGHDLGGGVIQIAAARQPKRCAGLMLTNAVAYDSWPVGPVRLVRRLGWIVGRAPTRVLEPFFRAALKSMHADTLIGKESAELHWAPYAVHGGGEALVRQARSLHVGDTLGIRDRIPALGLPARVVWGADDRFLRLRHGERLARDLGTRARAVPGAGHFTPEDCPEAVAESINELAGYARSDRGGRLSSPGLRAPRWDRGEPGSRSR